MQQENQTALQRPLDAMVADTQVHEAAKLDALAMVEEMDVVSRQPEMYKVFLPMIFPCTRVQERLCLISNQFTNYISTRRFSIAVALL